MQRDHRYGANALRFVPVYATAFASNSQVILLGDRGTWLLLGSMVARAKTCDR